MLVGVVLPPTAAAQLSNDVSLAEFSVTSTVAQTKMTPAFDPEVTSYFVAAPSEGDMVTVNVRPNHSGATLQWIGQTMPIPTSPAIRWSSQLAILR